MMGMSAESVEGAQRGLEKGIAELKAKYERLEAIEEAKEEAAAEQAKAAFRASAAGKAAEEAARVDMRMDDPEVEALRQQRMASLKAQAAARKQGLQEGRGELREIVEDEFLKEVTGARFVAVHFYHDEFMTCKVMVRAACGAGFVVRGARRAARGVVWRRRARCCVRSRQRGSRRLPGQGNTGAVCVRRFSAELCACGRAAGQRALRPILCVACRCSHSLTQSAAAAAAAPLSPFPGSRTSTCASWRRAA